MEGEAPTQQWETYVHSARDLPGVGSTQAGDDILNCLSGLRILNKY